VNIITALIMAGLLAVAIVLCRAGKNYWDSNAKVAAILMGIGGMSGIVALVLFLRLG